MSLYVSSLRLLEQEHTTVQVKQCEKINSSQYFGQGLVQSVALMDPQFTAHPNKLQLELSGQGSDKQQVAYEKDKETR